MVKKFIIIIFIFIFLLEFFSFVGTKLKLFIVNHEPNYFYSQGNNWRTENNLWGSWHKKNFKDKHVTNCYQVEYYSNNLGARDEINYDHKLPSNSIILLGDSLAEGLGVNFVDTFSEQLEIKLERNILNFGSAAHFGPLQAKILYENFYKEINHNEVILFFSPLNDFIDNNWDYWKVKIRKFRNRPYFKRNEITDDFEIYYPSQGKLKAYLSEFFFFKVQDNLNKYTYTANFLKTLNSVYSKFNKENKYYNSQNKINLDIHSYFIKDNDSVDGTMFSINELFKLSNNLKNKTLIIIPTLDDLIRIENGEQYKNLKWFLEIKKISKNYSINLIDLAEFFSAEQYKKYINVCDGHWNANGHKAVAEIVFKKIYSNK